MLHLQDTGGILDCLTNREQDAIVRKEETYVLKLSRINNANFTNENIKEWQEKIFL